MRIKREKAFHHRNGCLFTDECIVREPCLIFDGNAGKFVAIGEVPCLEEWAEAQGFALADLNRLGLPLQQVCEFLNAALDRQHDQEFFKSLGKLLKAGLFREAVILAAGKEDCRLPNLDFGSLVSDIEKDRRKEECLKHFKRQEEK